MNRDYIRFRAWDKKKKIIVYNIESYCYYQPIDPDDPEEFCFTDFIAQAKRFELMRSTSLKDIHSKTIFVGDKIKNKNKKIGFVHDDGDRFSWEYGQNWGEIEVEYDQIEIIGNKFEKPELL